MNDPLMAWATVVQAAATVIGFVFVGLQAWELKKTIRGDAHDSLYNHYAGLLAILVQKPHLHPYLSADRSATLCFDPPFARSRIR